MWHSFTLTKEAKVKEQYLKLIFIIIYIIIGYQDFYPIGKRSEHLTLLFATFKKETLECGNTQLLLVFYMKSLCLRKA